MQVDLNERVKRKRCDADEAERRQSRKMKS